MGDTEKYNKLQEQIKRLEAKPKTGVLENLGLHHPKLILAVSILK